MQEGQELTINIVRSGQEDEVVRLEPQLTVSQAKEELSAQLKIEGRLQFNNVILRSSRQLEIGKLYTLLVEDTPGASGGGAGLFPNVQEHFRHLLIQSHISNPRQEVLDMIARRLPSHMIVCNTTDAAVDLYQHAKLMPGVSTKGHLITQHGVRVNGPLFPRDTDGPPSLLVGSDATGCPCIVKLLAGTSQSGDCSEPGGSEAAVWRVIQQSPPADQQQSLPIASVQILKLTLGPDHSRVTGHPPGIYAALKMPHYCGSVASQLQLPEDAVVRGGIRMQSALSHIHSLGLVHMDVKAANFFVDMQGDWWLGDFGSAVSVGQPVVSTTAWFSSENLIGKPAQPQHDWYMLAVALVCELHKEDWQTVLNLPEVGHVAPSRLQQVIANVNAAGTRKLLTSILELSLL